jgi:GINS complex subunit Sld5.
MEEITPEVIFSKLQAERKTGELLPLPVDFYEQIDKEIENLKKNQSVEGKQYLENFTRLVNQLRERRTQKLLIYLAYNKQLPQPIPRSEENLFKKIKAIMNEETKSVQAKRIKINLDIPEIITPDGNKIGPFSKDQIIEINDDKQIEYILRNKIGELV